MKKQLKLLTAIGVLLFVCLAFAACGSEWDAPYPALDDEGYTVSVRFDANGGVFAGTNNVTVVDVFNPENAKTNETGEKEFSLLSPDDPLRGKEGAFPISRNGYVFAGWYAQRTLRTDESGTPLDEYGVPTSESEREQGYVYGGRWDFENDVLTVPADQKTSSDTPVLTLYAAWVPYYVYEIYAPDTATGEMALVSTAQLVTLEIPEWSAKTGKLDMKNFPKRDGMTFDGAFLDADMTTPLTEALTGEIDYESGISKSTTFRVYTKWLEGTWFKIETAEQFISNSRIDGSYIICADLDFTGLVWNAGLSKGLYTGTILGNGHTFSNVTVTQTDVSQSRGGLFGAIDGGARIEDLKLENVTYTISAGSRITAPTFGLLAGSIAEGATLTNVTVSGSLVVSEECYPAEDYQIGLVSGNGVNCGIDTSEITCTVSPDGSSKLAVTVNEDGSVELSFLNG